MLSTRGRGIERYKNEIEYLVSSQSVEIFEHGSFFGHRGKVNKRGDVVNCKIIFL